MSVSVWVQPPAGMWTPIGESAYPRVLPDSVHLEADEFGPSTATLTVDRGPRLLDPVLVPYARAWVEIDGARCFSGFVRTIDVADRQVTVGLQGTQMRLDDETLFWSPVDNRLTSWTGDLATAQGWTLNGQQQAGSTTIVLSWGSSGALIPIGTGARSVDFNAVTFNPTHGRVTGVLVAFTLSQTVSGISFGVFAHKEIANPIWSGYAVPWATTAATSGQHVMFATASTPARYVSMGLYTSTLSSAPSSVPANLTCTISAVIAVERTGYISGNTTSFLGSDAALRLQGMIPGLNADTSTIQQTATQVPFFYYDSGATPRTMLTDAASYDDAMVKIDALGRLVFAPRPAVPAIELGAMTPPSSESPADPSTRVAAVQITSQDASGLPVQRTVSVVDVPEMPQQPAGLTITNPDFASSNTGWQALGSTVGISTTSPPPGFNQYAVWESSSGGNLLAASYLLPTITGTLTEGIPAAFTFWACDYTTVITGTASVLTCLVYDANNMADSLSWFDVQLTPATSLPLPWQQYTLSFIPQETWTAPQLLFYSPYYQPPIPYANGAWQYPPQNPAITGIRAWVPAGIYANLTRVGTLSVSVTASDSQLLSLGRTYLRAYNRLGFTGQRLVGDGHARDPSSSAPLPAASLLTATGQYARLADRIDPADGKIGALAYVSQVAYEHASRQATVTYGQRYASVDELMARIQAPRTIMPRGRIKR